MATTHSNNIMRFLEIYESRTLFLNCSLACAVAMCALTIRIYGSWFETVWSASV